MSVLLCLALTSALTHSLEQRVAPEPEPEPAAGRDPLADARHMYKRGSAQFSAADYKSAIETWTELLSTLPDGTEFDAIRLDLLYNIAIAHDREYGYDHDERHLHQALTLFRRYAEANPDGGAAEYIAKIEGELEAHHDAAQDSSAEADTVPGPDPDDGSGSADPPIVDEGTPDKKMRGLGIGLLAGGGAAVAGGVGLLIAGARLEPAAEDSIALLDEMGVPDDDPSRDQATEFLASETKRGKIFMGVGGAIAGVGAVAIGVGAWALVKSKRPSNTASVRLVPMRHGLALVGRF